MGRLSVEQPFLERLESRVLKARKIRSGPAKWRTVRKPRSEFTNILKPAPKISFIGLNPLLRDCVLRLSRFVKIDADSLRVRLSSAWNEQGMRHDPAHNWRKDWKVSQSRMRRRVILFRENPHSDAETQGRASRIILNGVSAARRIRVNPPFERTSLKRRSPACAPRARPTS